MILADPKARDIGTALSGGRTRPWIGWLPVAVIAALTIARPAHADEATCGSLRNAFGPFDYRSARPADIEIVEIGHFTEDVEMLRKGSSGYIGTDLDYTLRALPNHPRALVSMINLQQKAKTDRPAGTHWPVSCYFDRAIRFQPNDGTVRTIFGVYLLRLGNASDAVTQFDIAASLGEDTGNLHYNLGLALFDLGRYDEAVVHAKKAEELGFRLPGLKGKLQKAGKWPSAP